LEAAHPAAAGQGATPLLLPSLRQHEDEWRQMLTTLGELYVRGVAVDWAGVDRPYVRRKLLLPTYPFQRERYWLSPPKQAKHGLSVRPLIHQVTRVPLHQETIFATNFSVETLPFLADHRVYNTVVSPGACQLAMILSAAELIFDRQTALTVRDVILPQPLVLPDNGDGRDVRTVQAVFTAHRANGPADTYDVKLISFAIDEQREESDLATHTTGEVTTLTAVQKETVNLGELRQRCKQAVDIRAFYTASAQAQIELGPGFCWLAELWQGQNNDAQAEALARLVLPEAVGVPTGYLLHPGLLDGCFQTANTAVAAPHSTRTGAASGETLLPFAVQALQLYQPAHGPQQQQWWCHATQIAPHQWNIRLCDEQGTLLAVVDGFEMRAASPQAFRQSDTWHDWLYEVTWQPHPYYGLAPDYLPTPATLMTTLADRVHARRDTADPRLWRGLEALSIEYVCAAFARAGFLLRAGEQWRLEQIVQQVSVIPSYRRLLYRLLMMLTDAGLLEYAAGVWTVRQTPAAVQPAARLADLQAVVGPAPEIALLARCGEKLSEVLRGLQEPEPLLYPNPATGEGTPPLLAHAPGAPAIYTLLQELVKQVVATLPTNRGLRILEIGAGPGAVTAGLLPLLPAKRTEYLFTDADATWVSQAAVRFAGYPFLHYHLFDSEQVDARLQMAYHQADLVIAVNVLHTMANVDQALAQIRRQLNAGGQLLLVETTQPSRFVELTWGLSPRWWQFCDNRQEQPLLSAAAWQTRLLAQGFQSVQWFEEEGCVLLIAQTARASSDAVPGQILGTASDETSVTGQPWLIFADRQGVGEALAGQLRSQGVASLLVYAAPHDPQLVATVADKIHETKNKSVQIQPDQAADYQRLLDAYPVPQGIVHLWSLDTPPAEVSTATLVASAQSSCGSVLHLLQALLPHTPELTGFWLVTQEAQAVTAQDPLSGVAQSTLWGMGRVIALEHPELTCICMDLPGADPVENRAAWLCAEIMATVRNAAQQTAGSGSKMAPQEREVVLRQEARYLARLTRHVANQGLPEQPYRLEVIERGTLDNLQLRPAPRRAPLAGEVEVAVQASGLNFRDLLNVLGMYPGDPGPIGAECAGVVVAVGPDVTNFTVGDEVLAMTPNSFSQYVTASTATMIHKPTTLSAAEAAALPSVFVTAYYGLYELAQIKAGDRVLIHAAAGGVGMAAVQLAQAVGAEVFATASPGKWAALQAMGVKQIYNSRTVDFAAQLLAETEGQGVEIVLNSLTGPGFIEANLATLAPGGYLIEMSKRDVWEAAQIAAVRPDVRYSLIDLVAVGVQQPDLLQTMLARIVALYAQKQLTPLPYTAFPIQQAIAAFRYMQQARHIGKIVLTVPSINRQTIQADATYLITGGLSGLGFAVAQWFATQGARHLILVGRSQPKAELQAPLAALAALGVTVTLAQADITIPIQVEAALQQIDDAYPLRGIVHAAGVLEDGALANQSWERFAKVLAPKVEGVWQLHRLTRNMTLDFFVVFSSTAGLLGNRGQANHAAANAFLDAFVYYRRAQGVPALSINWGAWAEIGAAAELVRTQQPQMFAQGMGVIPPQTGLDAFAYLLEQAITQTTGQPLQVGVVPIDWAKFLQNRLHLNPFYSEFRQAEMADPQPAESVRSVSLRQQFDEAASGEERDRLLQNYLQTAVARVLGLRHPEQIDPREGFLDMGLDSLMAVELRNQIGRTLETRLPSTLVFDYPTLSTLQNYLRDVLFGAEKEMPPAAPAPEATADQRATAEEADSDDEIAQLLAKLVYSGN
jgi:NADPH:quinone reductase-like Zn-dependent oxidoreductase/NAD(P)-dependent dehydrogenase (short-subunit alcohol dehydrogenase family)/SAM-dependent methyltransferase/acyl carrier protein